MFDNRLVLIWNGIWILNSTDTKKLISHETRKGKFICCHLLTILTYLLQATTGGGGWPMSVFLTPDLKPIFGGTYFPPEDMMYGRPGNFLAQPIIKLYFLKFVSIMFWQFLSKLLQNSRFCCFYVLRLPRVSGVI